MLVKLFIPFLFAVWPASVPASLLSDAAAAMKPGEWRELQTNGLSKSFLETYGYNGANHSILQYAAKAQWDPASEQFLFFGSPHDNPYKFILYDAATNRWRLGPLPDPCFDKGHYSGGCDVHSYYKSELDPASGKFYFFGRNRVQEYDIAGNAWTALPGAISGYTGYGGLAFIPKANGFLYTGGWGGTWWYSKSAQAWSTQPGSPLLGSYHDFALYNPLHKAVLLGGGNGVTTVLKMDSLRQVTPMKDSPYSIGTNNANIAIDPVSGKFIVYKDGAAMYEYDMAADTWKSITNLPPLEIRASFQTNIAAAPVWNHGVIMYLTHTPAKVYLYKHSGKTGEEGKEWKAEGQGRISVSPNPFRSDVIIRVSEPAAARGVVLNSRGRIVARLLRSRDGSFRAGGAELSGGVYFFRVETPDGSRLEKMLKLN